MEQLIPIQEHFENPVLSVFLMIIGLMIVLPLFGYYIWDFMYPLTKIGGKRKK
jgi:uncharacterized membrane protein